jgi:uncharacterized protein YbjT (DUF2867 family)
MVYKNVLVAGGTGKLGSKISRAFLSAGIPTSILVRKESLQKDVAVELKGLGARLVEGDLTQPDSLKDSLKDVDAVVSISSSVDQELNLFQAVVNAGSSIKRYIPSLWIPRVPLSDNILVAAKNKVVSQVTNSGLPYTLVWCQFFLDSPQFLHINPGKMTAEIYQSNKQVPVVHTLDIAGLMVHVLKDETLVGKSITLETERFTQKEAVAWMEASAKKQVTVTECDQKTLEERVQKGKSPTFQFFQVFNSQYMLSIFFSDLMDSIGESKALYPDYKPIKTAKQYFTDVAVGKESQYKDFGI